MNSWSAWNYVFLLHFEPKKEMLNTNISHRAHPAVHDFGSVYPRHDSSRRQPLPFQEEEGGIHLSFTRFFRSSLFSLSPNKSISKSIYMFFCQDLIDYTSVNFIGRKLICGYYLRGRVLLDIHIPHKDSKLRVINLIIDGRREKISIQPNESRVWDGKFPAYVIPRDLVVPNDITTNILWLLQIRLDQFQNVKSCSISNLLRLIVELSIKTALCLRCLTKLFLSRLSLYQEKPLGTMNESK